MSFARVARDLRLVCALVEEATKLFRRCQELTRPVTPPRVPLNVKDISDEVRRGLLQSSWVSEEIYFAIIECVRLHEALISFDTRCITTGSGKKIARSWLRERNAPLDSTNREKFLSRFLPIPEAAAPFPQPATQPPNKPSAETSLGVAAVEPHEPSPSERSRIERRDHRKERCA